MIRNIHLYGALAEVCEPEFKLDVKNPAEAVRGIISNFPEAIRVFRDNSFYVVKGETLKDGQGVEEEFLHFGLGKDSLHFMPVVAGAGSPQSKGMITTIVGVALIGAAVVASGGFAAVGAGALGSSVIGSGILAGTSWGTIALFGASLVFGGISLLLAPTPQQVDTGESVERKPSHL